ncbi:hypothetical protein ACWIBQ_03405 [Microbacterium keratanolyticum]
MIARLATSYAEFKRALPAYRLRAAQAHAAYADRMFKSAMVERRITRVRAQQAANAVERANRALSDAESARDAAEDHFYKSFLAACIALDHVEDARDEVLEAAP